MFADRLIFGTSTGTIEILQCFSRYINYWSLHKYGVGTKDKVRVVYIAWRNKIGRLKKFLISRARGDLSVWSIRRLAGNQSMRM